MPADTPTTPLMQDGCWLVDQAGRRVAMVFMDPSYGPCTRFAEGRGSLADLRAVKAYMEQQERERCDDAQA